MELEGALLTCAVGETIKRCQTALPEGIPTGRSASFGDDAMKQVQWAAFLREFGATDTPDLPTVVAQLHEFPMPIFGAGCAGKSAPSSWPAGGPRKHT
jgi:hypothetical protein